MKGLVGCEYSGRVRDAFNERGHDFVSLDLLPSDSDKGPHIQGDLLAYLDTVVPGQFDIGIFHPPCTHLAVSGARWFPEKIADGRQQAAIAFFLGIWEHRHKFTKGVCLENPVSIMSTHLRKPNQVFQPWQFGHGEVKATCLWLDKLPFLRSTNIVPGRDTKMHMMSPGPDRWKKRSTTYLGVAAAMAEQWGVL